jgi:hypothetical protein
MNMAWPSATAPACSPVRAALPLLPLEDGGRLNEMPLRELVSDWARLADWPNL